MSQKEIELDKNSKQTKLLKALYVDTMTLIQKRLFRRAYQQLDKFYYVNNVKNQISPFDRIVVNKRIIYVLQKILFIYVNKKPIYGQVKQQKFQEKGQQIITRLSIALHEQYIIICQLMEFQNIPSNFRDLMTDHINTQRIDEEDELVPKWINQDFTISVRKEVNLQQIIIRYFSSLLQCLIYMSYWYRRIKDISTQYVYAKMASDTASRIYFKYIRLDKELFTLGNLHTKCFINLSSCLYVANLTQNALEVLNTKDYSINLQICTFIEEYTSNTNKKSITSQNIFRKAIKTEIGFLLANCLYHRELNLFTESLKDLSFAQYIVVNFIPSTDEIKKYVLNICHEMIPYLEDQQVSQEQLEFMFNLEFEQETVVQDLFRIRRNQKSNKIEAKNSVGQHFDSQNYKRFDFKFINDTNYHVMPNFKSSQIKDIETKIQMSYHSGSRTTRAVSLVPQIDSIHLNTNLIDLMALQSPEFANPMSKSVRNSSRTQLCQSARSQISRSYTSIKKNSINKSQESIKLLTTERYFQTQIKKPTIDVQKITKYLIGRDKEQIYKNKDIQEFFDKEKNQLEKEMHQIVNFDANLRVKKLGSFKMASDNQLQKLIQQSLIKEHLSKNMLIVDQEYSTMKQDENFDRKEFKFCKSMLQFKKNYSKQQNKQSLYLASHALKVVKDSKTEKILIVQKADQSIRRKKSILNFFIFQAQIVQDTELTEEDRQIMTEGANLTPLQKLRNIILKHKETFDLDNFKVNLRLYKPKEAQPIINSPKIKIKESTVSSQKRARELFMNVLKEYETIKDEGDRKYKNHVELKSQSLPPDRRSTNIATKYSNLAESTEGQAILVKPQNLIDVLQMGLFIIHKDKRKH